MSRESWMGQASDLQSKHCRFKSRPNQARISIDAAVMQPDATIAVATCYFSTNYYYYAPLRVQGGGIDTDGVYVVTRWFICHKCEPEFIPISRHLFWGRDFPPNLQFLLQTASEFVLNLFFSRDNELPIYHENFLLTGNNHRNNLSLSLFAPPQTSKSQWGCLLLRGTEEREGRREGQEERGRESPQSQRE